MHAQLDTDYPHPSLPPVTFTPTTSQDDTPWSLFYVCDVFERSAALMGAVAKGAVGPAPAIAWLLGPGEQPL